MNYLKKILLVLLLSPGVSWAQTYYTKDVEIQSTTHPSSSILPAGTAEYSEGFYVVGTRVSNPNIGNSYRMITVTKIGNQTNNILWSKEYKWEDNTHSTAMSVVKGDHDDLYVLGRANAAEDGKNTPFILKIKSDGTIDKKTALTEGGDLIKGIGYQIIRSIDKDGHPTVTVCGDYGQHRKRAFAASFDTDLTVLWAKKYEIEILRFRQTKCRSIAQVNDKDFVATIYSIGQESGNSIHTGLFSIDQSTGNIINKFPNDLPSVTTPDKLIFFNLIQEPGNQPGNSYASNSGSLCDVYVGSQGLEMGGLFPTRIKPTSDGGFIVALGYEGLGSSSKSGQVGVLKFNSEYRPQWTYGFGEKGSNYGYWGDLEYDVANDRLTALLKAGEEKSESHMVRIEDVTNDLTRSLSAVRYVSTDVDDNFRGTEYGYTIDGDVPFGFEHLKDYNQYSFIFGHNQDMATPSGTPLNNTVRRYKTIHSYNAACPLLDVEYINEPYSFANNLRNYTSGEREYRTTNLSTKSLSIETQNKSAIETVVCESTCDFTATITGPSGICPNSTSLTNITCTNGVSWSWAHGPTTSTIGVSNPGTYTVTAWDQNGCSDTKSFTLSTYTNGTNTNGWNIVPLGPVCGNGNPITLVLQDAQGNPVSNVTWNGPGVTGNTLDPTQILGSSSAVSATWVDPVTGCDFNTSLSFNMSLYMNSYGMPEYICRDYSTQVWALNAGEIMEVNYGNGWVVDNSINPFAAYNLYGPSNGIDPFTIPARKCSTNTSGCKDCHIWDIIIPTTTNAIVSTANTAIPISLMQSSNLSYWFTDPMQMFFSGDPNFGFDPSYGQNTSTSAIEGEWRVLNGANPNFINAYTGNYMQFNPGANGGSGTYPINVTVQYTIMGNKTGTNQKACNSDIRVLTIDTP